MVNRNAARHLALVVSILLCFFVYMGYRFRGQAESPPETGAAPLRPADLAATAESLRPGGQAALMTVNDNQPVTAPPSVRIPVETPSGSPGGVGGNEAMPDLSGLLLADRDNELSPPPPSDMPPPPSGSIEESAIAAPVGSITGLVPAPPLSPPERAPVAPPASAPIAAPPQRPVAAPPSLPSNSLKPPGQPSGGSVLAPPPAAAPAGGGRTPAATAPARVAPPNGGPSAPSTTTPVRPERTQPPPAPTPPAAAGRGGGTSANETRIYVIRPGDTLSRIAAEELGSIALANNIFLLNRGVIADPDHLLVGTRILIPVREDLDPAALAPTRPAAGAGLEPPARPATNGSRERIHRVARGETLSSIALRYYGSSTAWRFLYEANANVVPNPNRLSVGTELVIPPFGER